MRCHAKPLLLLVATLLAIPALLLTVLNFFLQCGAMQERIRSGIEGSVGLPISFSGISGTLCGGIKVQGISLKGDQSGAQGSLDSLIFYPEFLKLLQGEVVIKELCLEHPVLQIALAPNASINLPLQTKHSLPASFAPSSISVIPAPIPQLPAQTPSPVAHAEKILLKIAHLTVSGGNFKLLASDSRPILSIENLNLSGKQTLDRGWAGDLKATQITEGSALILHDFCSAVTLPADISSILLDKIAATLGAGNLAGSFSITLPPAIPQYKTHLILNGATLPQFFQDASIDIPATEGTTSGEIQLSGIAGTPQRMEGEGNLLCANAVIQPAGFLKQIGQILQIEELQLLRMPEGKMIFRIHQGEFQIDQISLRSENLILAAQGPIHSNGDLDLQARLLLNEKLTGRLHGFLGPQLTKAPEPGYSQVSFHVSGPIKNPTTDFLARLTGIHINGDLGGLLQGLFGRPR